MIGARLADWIYDAHNGLLMRMRCQPLVGLLRVYKARVVALPVPLASPSALVPVSDCTIKPWTSVSLQGDHGVQGHFGASAHPVADPVGELCDTLVAYFNGKLGDGRWSKVFESDDCTRKLFDTDAIFAFTGWQAAGVEKQMYQQWSTLFRSRDQMSYGQARDALVQLGGTTRTTSDVLGSAAYDHLGLIYRMGGHASRLPYLTLATFLTPNTFKGMDNGIEFTPMVNTMLLAEGGVRKSANAGYWRRRLDSAKDILASKGLAHRFALKGDPPPPPRAKNTTAKRRHRTLNPTLPADPADPRASDADSDSGGQRVIHDPKFVWRTRNSRFTFEGAVDVTACVAFGGPRLLLDSDELSITVAAQGQRDATILATGELVTLLDADGHASKVSAGTRRAVPDGAKVACSFGCQPKRARDYVAAWDALNIGARFMVYCADERNVLTTTYGQLHADREDTTAFIEDKLRAQCELYFGSLQCRDLSQVQASTTVAAPHVRHLEIDWVSSRLLQAAWDGAKKAAMDHATPGDPIEMWLRKADQELRHLLVAISIDVFTTLRVLNPLFEVPMKSVPILAYLAIAQFQVFAYHRRPAVDDSLRAKGQRQDAQVAKTQPALDIARVPSEMHTQVDSLHVAFAVLADCCEQSVVSVFDSASFCDQLLQGRGLARWGTVEAALHVFGLAARAGIVKSADHRLGRTIAQVDAGTLQFNLVPIRYQQGGRNVAPHLQLYSRDAVELVQPALFVDAAKVLEDYGGGAAVVTNVTPEQISVRGVDYYDPSELLFLWVFPCMLAVQQLR